MYSRCLLLFVVSLLIFGCSSKSVPTDLVGTKLPLLRLTYADGSSGSSESYRGKQQVYLFWAEWCADSRQELVRLKQFAEQSAVRDDRALVAVNVDERLNENKVRALIRDHSPRGVVHVYSGNGVYDDAFTTLDLNEVPLIVTVLQDGTITSVSDKFQPAFFQ